MRIPALFAVALCFGTLCFAQNQQPAGQDQSAAEQQPPAPAPSLGELARQLKLKKQQKQAQMKQAKEVSEDSQTSESAPVDSAGKAHLVTNDDTPERASVTPASTHSADSAGSDSPAKNDPAKAENWKLRILAQKNAIAALEQDIKTTSESIHFAGGNCVANCAQWNERQQQKQQQVETMKAQLEEAQKALEDLQESARKEGFGSSVYDP